MEKDFWHQRWERGEIGFHGSRPNPLLQQHLDRLGLAPGARIFLPLCGKTLDIHWLRAQGLHVLGAELSPVAVEQLFAEQGLTPTIREVGALQHYSAERIDIYVGDLFALTAEVLGPVAAVYDRAALVALPPDMRTRYAAHLIALTAAAPQLLICFTYDQRAMSGPPFSIADAEVERHYQAIYSLERVAQVAVEGGLRGLEAEERVWLLQPRPVA